MAPTDWRTGLDLRRALSESPETFGMFQILRLLDGLTRGPKSGRSELVGTELDPARGRLRFHGALDAAFPTASIGRVRVPPKLLGLPAVEDAAPARRVPKAWRSPQGLEQIHLELNALGFGGPQGPMPAALMQELRQRQRLGDDGAVAFLDIFIHRIMALTWSMARETRPELETRAPERSRSGTVPRAVAGLLPQAARNRAGVPDRVLLRYAPLLARRPLSGEALRRVVADFLGTTVTLRQLVGRWLPLSTQDRCRLGRSDGNARLGRDLVLGERVWRQTGGIELEIGPLDRTAFAALLPGGERYRQLRSLLRFCLNAPLEIRAVVSLRHDQVPPLHLSATGEARLGWTSWLGSGLDTGHDRRVGFTLLRSTDVISSSGPKESAPWQAN